MGTRLAATTAVALLVVVLTGATCSSDDDDAADDTGPSSTPTTQSPEAEVEAAYLAFAEMGERLLQAPDPEDPEIAERTTGEARAELEGGLRSLRDSGMRYVLGEAYGHDVLSTEVDADQAVLKVCVVDDSRQVDSAGEVIAEGTTTVEWTVEMQRPSSEWLVASIIEDQVREGVVECE